MTPDLRDRSARALQVITADGRSLEAGRAALFVLDQLGYRRLAALGNRPALRPLVEAGYRLVARHRGLLGRFWPGPDRPVAKK